MGIHFFNSFKNSTFHNLDMSDLNSSIKTVYKPEAKLNCFENKFQFGAPSSVTCFQQLQSQT